jgi:hypothetical protein
MALEKYWGLLYYLVKEKVMFSKIWSVQAVYIYRPDSIHIYEAMFFENGPD